MDWIDVLVTAVFIGAFLWALADMYKKKEEGQKKPMHYRSIKSPVPSNLELFEMFNPQKTEDESEEKG